MQTPLGRLVSEESVGTSAFIWRKDEHPSTSRVAAQDQSGRYAKVT